MPQLRLIHLMISLAAMVMTVIFVGMRALRFAEGTSFPTLLGWLMSGMAALTLTLGAVVRSSLAPVDPATGEEGWLAANRGKCIVLWAILEGGVVLSALALFMGANPFVAGAIAAIGLGFLASQSPGTLAGH